MLPGIQVPRLLYQKVGVAGLLAERAPPSFYTRPRKHPRALTQLTFPPLAGAPELSFEIVGRPEGVRPIPGETVQFTCTVQTVSLTWSNSNFTNVSAMQHTQALEKWPANVNARRFILSVFFSVESDISQCA